MKFPPSLLDDIRARLPVSQVVGRSVALKKAGREWRGLSPFKTEKTPSFYVNDQKGFYHCFASGEHGDIFTFVMKIEGLSFPEAVERLAQEAGVALPKPEPRSPEQERRIRTEEEKQERLYALLAASQEFFTAQLRSGAGTEARRYAEDKRGLSRETIAAFGLGYAPPGRRALRDHLAAKGFALDEMVTSGMLIGGDDIPEPYDRFRHQVMFPIADLKGRVIAFGGRALEADVPAKYLNSPETPLFHKGAVLFNAARARPVAHAKSRIIAVEGYMDVVALTEGGFGESVAPLGTALTEDQIRILWRMSAEPILCFDGDSAGRKAAFRAVDTVLPHLKPGTSLRFAFLPDGLDPDDLIRQQGPSAMENCLARTRSLVDVLWEREWTTGDWTTPERRAQLELQLNLLIARIGDNAVRIHYQKDVRNRLYEAWGAVRRQQSWSPAPTRRSGQQRPYDRSRAASQPARGSAGRPGAFQSQGGVRGPASESLRRSRLGSGAAAGPAPREAILMLALLNHPWLIEQCCEELADLEFSFAPLNGLKTALLEIAAAASDSTPAALDAAHVRTQLRQSGLDGLVGQIERSFILIVHASIVVISS